MKGVGDNKFEPDRSVSREEIATLLTRQRKLSGEDVSADKAAINEFADSAKISSWAVDGVAYCTKSGLVQGPTPGKVFAPPATPPVRSWLPSSSVSPHNAILFSDSIISPYILSPFAACRRYTLPVSGGRHFFTAENPECAAGIPRFRPRSPAHFRGRRWKTPCTTTRRASAAPARTPAVTSTVTAVLSTQTACLALSFIKITAFR